jgi:hypothetical protein
MPCLSLLLPQYHDTLYCQLWTSQTCCGWKNTGALQKWDQTPFYNHSPQPMVALPGINIWGFSRFIYDWLQGKKTWRTLCRNTTEPLAQLPFYVCSSALFAHKLWLSISPPILCNSSHLFIHSIEDRNSRWQELHRNRFRMTILVVTKWFRDESCHLEFLSSIECMKSI